MLKEARNKGITLIALIITIIVLLILAGVTISAITGNESVMEKAKEAKEKQEASTEIEKLQLAYISAIADLEKTNITAQELEDYLNNNVNMNVLVGEGQYFHDKTNDKYWAYNESYSLTDVQNIQYLKNNINASIEIERCKYIMLNEKNQVYLVSADGKIKDSLILCDFYKLSTGFTSTNIKAIVLNVGRIGFSSFDTLDAGFLMQNNSGLGYNDNVSHLSTDKNNIGEYLKVKGRKFSMFENENQSHWYNYVSGIGNNVDMIFYARTYIVIRNKNTGEEETIYGEPISVTYNQIQALEQGN